MSLSLRYTPLTSNLHVSIVGKLPPEFPLASSNACINHNRSGPSIFVYTQSTFIEPIQQSLQNAKSENIENVIMFHFHYMGIIIQIISIYKYSRLLGPCYKTGRI